MKVQQYMIPIYAALIQRNGWTLDRLPTIYQIPVAEYLAAQEAEKLQ